MKGRKKAWRRRAPGTPRSAQAPARSSDAIAAAGAAVQDLKSAAREMIAGGIDPRDPLVRAFSAPVIEARLAADGKLADFRKAGIDPWDALCAAADAVDSEDPA